VRRVPVEVLVDLLADLDRLVVGDAGRVEADGVAGLADDEGLRLGGLGPDRPRAEEIERVAGGREDEERRQEPHFRRDSTAVDAARPIPYCAHMRLACLAIVAAACNLTTFTANQTAPVLKAALPALAQESDLQLARDAAPGQLKTVEGF